MSRGSSPTIDSRIPYAGTDAQETIMIDPD